MDNPLVGIIMGSKSDMPTMQQAVDIFKEFGISHEVKVLSAHRTPDATLDYAASASSRGMKIIIAGAGGAAHLPGVIAAKTELPVIGVPIQSKALNGLDSLLSIVQMPPGVPVATVGIGGSANAALLAARILGLESQEIKNKLLAFIDNQRKKVEADNDIKTV